MPRWISLRSFLLGAYPTFFLHLCFVKCVMPLAFLFLSLMLLFMNSACLGSHRTPGITASEKLILLTTNCHLQHKEFLSDDLIKRCSLPFTMTSCFYFHRKIEFSLYEGTLSQLFQMFLFHAVFQLCFFHRQYYPNCDLLISVRPAW